jgi:PAS domain S-box-containing protein
MDRTILPPEMPEGFAARLAEARSWIGAPEEFPARFRLFFDDAPIGMAVRDPHGHILEVNRALCALLGYEQKELVGRALRTLTHPDDQAREDAAVATLNDGRNEAYEIEKRYVRRDGQTVHALVRGTAIRNGRGPALGSIIQVVDITARMRAEEALKESEQRFRSAFDDAAVGMSIQALDGSLMQVNAALCALTERSQDDLLASGLLPILHPEDREAHEQLLSMLRRRDIRTHHVEER